MSLNQLSKNILNSTQEKINKINEDFEKECSFLESESFKKINEFKEKKTQEFLKEIKVFKNKILGNGKREAKRIILNKKTQIIYKTKLRFKQYLYNLKLEERANLFEELLKKNKFDFDLIICQRKDSQIFKNYLEYNNLKNIKIKINSEIQGFELYKNNFEKIDYSYDELTNILFDKFDEKIQNKLIGNKY